MIAIHEIQTPKGELPNIFIVSPFSEPMTSFSHPHSNEMAHCLKPA